MIQRPQTIWLLLASALAFATLKLSLFSGNLLVENLKQFQRFTAMSSIPLMILTVGVAIASLIAIFLFKNRKLQIRISLAALVVSLLTIFLGYLQTKNFLPDEWSFDLTSLLYVAIPILLILAIRGIYLDEKLIKSVDRLR
ncbi:MAG: DUF4293 domain-containing protein [Bacteroidota bacterium]|nr:DUF4293 domain-containing protein [Bacteroidota bacterium]